MPTAPPRVCNRCRKPTTGRRCTCAPPAWTGSSWTGGSTRAYRKIRAQQLLAHPLCQWAGCPALADVVDHKQHLAQFPPGPEREAARLDPNNLQSLCHPHHDEKTAAEAARSKRR